MERPQDPGDVPQRGRVREAIVPPAGRLPFEVEHPPPGVDPDLILREVEVAVDPHLGADVGERGQALELVVHRARVDAHQVVAGAGRGLERAQLVAHLADPSRRVPRLVPPCCGHGNVELADRPAEPLDVVGEVTAGVLGGLAPTRGGPEWRCGELASPRWHRS